MIPPPPRPDKIANGLRRAVARMRDHLALDRAIRAASPVDLSHVPEPEATGRYEVGQAILARALPSADAEALLNDPITGEAGAVHQVWHGFDWLDDLAALGTPAARRRAQDLLASWIARNQKFGPGWAPDLAGRRVQEWLHHSAWLMRSLPEARRQEFLTSLNCHATYLDRRAGAVPAGMARFAALVGWLQCQLCLPGSERDLGRATDTLGLACTQLIAPDGGIASRNPEELLEVFTALERTASLLATCKQPPIPALDAAIARAGPALRALRLGDGSLVRFHGGGAGRIGRLDRALSEARVKTGKAQLEAMGFVRTAAGRVILVMDCAAPPDRAINPGTQASTLGFEITSGRRPMIVNGLLVVGKGRTAIRNPRTTLAHNTAMLDRLSSSLRPTGGWFWRALGLAGSARPPKVEFGRAGDLSGSWVQTRHDGYRATHGLDHERRIFLDTRGTTVHGEERVSAADDKNRRRLIRRLRRLSGLGAAMDVRFHVHPDVDLTLSAGSDCVTLSLKSGERWDFRAGGAQITLGPSHYLDPETLMPRATYQIILHRRVLGSDAMISWNLTRKGRTTHALRDLAIDEAPAS